MSENMPELFIALYCKIERDEISERAVFVRAYKYGNPLPDKTPQFSHLVYSYKAKRYVIANFYVMNWKGEQRTEVAINRDLWRWALRRIGLDIR